MRHAPTFASIFRESRRPVDLEVRVREPGEFRGQPNGAGYSVPQRIHVAEISRRVWMLKTAVAALAGDLPTDPGAFGDDFPEVPATVRPELVRANLTCMLGVFSPGLVIPGEASGGSGEDGVYPESLRHNATALEVCALQVYNAIVRDQGWKRCEKCSRVFSRQRGRAVFQPNESHRRSDVKYCSKRCSQAAATAKSRARKRALKQEGEKND